MIFPDFQNFFFAYRSPSRGALTNSRPTRWQVTADALRGRRSNILVRLFHPYGVATPTTSQTSHRLAMLIDGENAEASLLGQMLEEASKHGTVKIRRIYGDWTRPQMSQWREPANTYAFHTPHQIAFTSGKNATDSFLIIDAMDLLHSGSVDGFCIVSSDSDFTGLAKRIREQELFMMGIGRGGTPKSFQNACDFFVSTEILPNVQEAAAASVGSDSFPGTGGAPDGRHAEPTGHKDPLPPSWIDLVLRALDMIDGEWGMLADVGNNIRKLDPSFDPRAYGSKTLLALVETAPNIFQIRAEGTPSAPQVHYIKAFSK